MAFDRIEMTAWEKVAAPRTKLSNGMPLTVPMERIGDIVGTPFIEYHAQVTFDPAFSDRNKLGVVAKGPNGEATLLLDWGLGRWPRGS